MTSAKRKPASTLQGKWLPRLTDWFLFKCLVNPARVWICWGENRVQFECVKIWANVFPNSSALEQQSRLHGDRGMEAEVEVEADISNFLHPSMSPLSQNSNENAGRIATRWRKSHKILQNWHRSPTPTSETTSPKYFPHSQPILDAYMSNLRCLERFVTLLWCHFCDILLTQRWHRGDLEVEGQVVVVVDIEEEDLELWSALKQCNLSELLASFLPKAKKRRFDWPPHPNQSICLSNFGPRATPPPPGGMS